MCWCLRLVGSRLLFDVLIVVLMFVVCRYRWVGVSRLRFVCCMLLFVVTCVLVEVFVLLCLFELFVVCCFRCMLFDVSCL